MMRKFFSSFKFAVSGVIYCIKNERNVKIHLIAAILVIIAGLLTKISPFEWLIIIIFIVGVLSLELMNSAIERIVDLVTMEYHPLAKIAKDAAAGSVLIFSIGSIIAAIMIFIPKWLNLY